MSHTTRRERFALKTARGRLTAYAFACGYAERSRGVLIWREHGTYHARAESWRGDPSKWRSSLKLRAARAHAAALRREAREARADARRAKREADAAQRTRGRSDTCAEPERVTCGNCGRAWCEKCDGAPSALCHYCHGRGYSFAALAREVS